MARVKTPPTATRPSDPKVAPGERAIVWLVAASAILLPIRMLAAQTVGFGDSEALYASYALHPQPAYLDHPGLVGLLARALGSGSAPTPLVTHTFTAIVVTLAPWLLVCAARAAGASWKQAATAGLAVAVVPEVCVGMFAMTPDLILYLCWVGALGFAALGLSYPSSSGGAAFALTMAGLLAGVGCAAKVSAITLVAALVLTFLSRDAREHARTPWPWIGIAVGLFVTAPIVLFEVRTGWPMIRHRLVDTQPGAGLSFRNAAALLLGQLVYLSPLVAVAAAVVARDLWKERGADATSQLLANATFVPLVILLPLCLWSRVAEPHWIAPALLALPIHAARRRTDGQMLLGKALARASIATAAALSLGVHAWVLLPGLLAWMPASYDSRLDIANELYGWPQVATAVRRVAAEERVPLTEGEDVAAVGPHWIVCAQLEAAIGPSVRVGCDDPLRDDFDDWMPRSRWKAANVLLYVSDNRFPDPDYDRLFPDRALKRESRVSVVRGGKVTRSFTIAVLPLRGAASFNLEHRRLTLRRQRGEPGVAQEGQIVLFVGVRRGQELVAVEDRVRAGHQAEHLRLARQRGAACGQAHARARHQDARRRDHADELERVDRGPARERRAGDRDERVDRDALGLRVHARELAQHLAAVVDALAHADDSAGADRNSGGADVT
jgi:hypothetical protein